MPIGYRELNSAATALHARNPFMTVNLLSSFALRNRKGKVLLLCLRVRSASERSVPLTSILAHSTPTNPQTAAASFAQWTEIKQANRIRILVPPAAATAARSTASILPFTFHLAKLAKQ